MALKHIAKYRAMVTGNTIQEEMAVLRVREKGSYKELFRVEDEFSKKINLGGKCDERQERF